uniref:Reverse transcriptase RNase H-like domain-containing protein n=1 Tax=Erpetoichthys calabaricus TaxID=27687 RepID=A0A8C4SA69_ERPCA
MMLSVKKLQVNVSKVCFHDHSLSASGLKADPEKVTDIMEMSCDVKTVKYLVGFLTNLEPLRRLTDKATVWYWILKHDTAAWGTEQLVTSILVLLYYGVSKAVCVQSDSAEHGLGCCLLQKGKLALSYSEINYSQIKNKCLSIIFACQHFHNYLYACDKVTAETDHNPLV